MFARIQNYKKITNKILCVVSVLIVTFLTIGTPQTLLAKTKKFYSFKSGLWYGGAYKNIETNSFSHCIIEAKYISNTVVLFSLNRLNNFSIGLYNKNWSIPIGEIFNLSIRIDNAFIGKYRTTSVLNNAIEVIIPSNDKNRIYQKLRNGYRLQIFALKKNFLFKLSGTHSALQKLLNCTRLMTAIKSNKHPLSENNLNNPFTEQKTNKYQNPFSESNKQIPKNYSFLSKQKKEDQKWVASLLSLTGLKNIKFFSENKIKSLNAYMGWKADDQFGLLYSFTPKKSLESIMQQTLSLFGEKCKGNYALALNTTEYFPDGKLKEGTGVCKTGERQVTTNALGIFVTLDNKVSAFVFITRPLKEYGAVSKNYLNKLKRVIKIMMKK